MNDTEALLEQLRGIKEPAVSHMPAVGWWLLSLLLLSLIFAVWKLISRYQHRAWVRQALAELDSIRRKSGDVPVVESLSGVSRLARRVLLAARPRMDVAGLHGDQWMKELDALCGRDLFTHGYGQMIETGPYQRQPDIKASDLQGLFDAMNELIKAAGRRKEGVSG